METERCSRVRRLFPAVGALFAILCTLAVIYGLYYNADRMRPAQPGNARDFWMVAGWIRWPDHEPSISSGGRYLLDADDYYYTRNHIHGSNLYLVSKADALSALPDVRDNLESRSEESKEGDIVVAAYRDWLTTGSKDPEKFLERLQELRIASSEFRQEYEALYQHLLELRIAKTRYYSANVVFEFLWLTMIIWGVFGPLIRRMHPIRFLLYWLFAPLFFVLPVYLGYATNSFTSIGPSGGVLYPHLVNYFRGGRMMDIERDLLVHVPPVLSSISQDTGEPIVVTGMGLCGPISLILVGLLPCAAAAVIAFARRKAPEQANVNSTPLAQFD